MQSFFEFLVSVINHYHIIETALNDFVYKEAVTQNIFSSLVQGIVIED